MKYLFLVIAVLLAVASVFVFLGMPGVRDDRRALIYWTTDPNPARAEQIRLFDEWQARVGLVEEDGTPMIGIELDTGNNENTKKIVQSVSGVAGDTMDLFGGRDARFFSAMDVLVDVTEYGEALGYSPDTTYPAIGAEIAVANLDGEPRQFLYPCNVALSMYIVNNDLFRDLGIEPPSGRWTVEEFEQVGREFVAAANPDDPRVGRVFFADNVGIDELRRSFGVDFYNETLTDVNLEAPESVRALKLLRKWTYEDRLLPTGADRDAFATSGGYGGAAPDVFERGYYGMFKGGRWLLIRFRDTNKTRVAQGQEPLDLGTCELPHGGHPTVNISTRAAAVYVDGKLTDEPIELKDEYAGVTIPAGTPWGVFFQAFLASPEYNEQIIADADGLPGNPEVAEGDLYYRPEPNPEMGIYAETEYQIHGPHLEAAKTIADPGSYSPFVLAADAAREAQRQVDEFMTDPPLVPSAERAMEVAAGRVRRQIADTLEARPELAEEYERRLADQERIDELKAAGEKIPAELVRNPFYLRYYRERGLLDESAGRDAGGPRMTESELDDGPASKTPEGDPLDDPVPTPGTAADPSDITPPNGPTPEGLPPIGGPEDQLQ